VSILTHVTSDLTRDRELHSAVIVVGCRSHASLRLRVVRIQYKGREISSEGRLDNGKSGAHLPASLFHGRMMSVVHTPLLCRTNLPKVRAMLDISGGCIV